MCEDAIHDRIGLAVFSNLASFALPAGDEYF
jgi:hypothetical protein